MRDVNIGIYASGLSICHDGYSLSQTPVPGLDTSEVLARINDCQPLTSIDGSYQSEIMKTVFNIGLKKAEGKPLWIVPNSLRYSQHGLPRKESKELTRLELETPGSNLHRQFAGLTGKDEKAILEFAKKYGLLKRYTVHDLVFTNGSSQQQAQLGESLLWWREEIEDLAMCLGLWDMVLSDDSELKNVVLWHRDGITIRLDDSYIQLVGMANMNLLSRWNHGDAKGPALHYLSLEMDKRLLNTLTLRMLSSPDQKIYISPDSLLASIWLMFFCEVSGRTRLLLCASCGEYFESTDPRAVFCSTRCRMRNHRKRNAQKSREPGKEKTDEQD